MQASETKNKIPQNAYPFPTRSATLILDEQPFATVWVPLKLNPERDALYAAESPLPEVPAFGSAKLSFGDNTTPLVLDYVSKCPAHSLSEHYHFNYRAG